MNKKILLLLPLLGLTFACLGAPAETTPVVGAPIVPTQVAATVSASTPEIPPPVALLEFLEMQVAFTRNGNIWVWSQPTGARQLTFDGDANEVHISDDGAVIVYQRGSALWAVNNDGSSPRLLVDAPAFTGRALLSQFDFQPNTHTVFFSTKQDPINPYDVHDLNRVNADAPVPQSLVSDGGGIFTFSQDGNFLALAQLERINVVHADGTALVTALAFQQINTGADWYYIPQVVWLADTTGFYTVIPAQNVIANPAEKSRFLYVAADGAFNAQLAEFNAASVHVAKPLIAPNGSKLTYVSQEGTALSLHVIDASTSDGVVVAYPNAGLVIPWAWSPDSNRFAFWTRDPAQIQLTGLNLPALPLIETIVPYSLTWVSADTFLYFVGGTLRLGQVGNPNLLVIASDFLDYQPDTRNYDFAK